MPELQAIAAAIIGAIGGGIGTWLKQRSKVQRLQMELDEKRSTRSDKRTFEVDDRKEEAANQAVKEAADRRLAFQQAAEQVVAAVGKPDKLRPPHNVSEAQRVLVKASAAVDANGGLPNLADELRDASDRLDPQAAKSVLDRIRERIRTAQG